MIVKAIPAGSKRARSQRSYLRAVVADPVIASLRADRRRAVLELARILARQRLVEQVEQARMRGLAAASPLRHSSSTMSSGGFQGDRRLVEVFLVIVAGIRVT